MVHLAVLVLVVIGQVVSADQQQQLALSAATSGFSQRLYQKVALDKPNVIYSPYSIHAALTMTPLGARGDTATEMAAALGVTALGSTTHQIYKELITEMNAVTDVALNTGNAIFVNPYTTIVPQFIEDVTNNYFAKTANFDLSAPEGPEKAVNDYIAQATENMIQNVLQKGFIDGSTVMVLVNTIFFNGTWASSFPKYGTSQQDFRRLGGAVSQVDMMHDDKTIKIKRDNANKVDVAELPFKGGRFSLYIALPQQVDGITDLVPSDEMLDIIGDNDKQKSKPHKPDNGIDLLLIGHTGNGKSETGNMILGKTWFKANANTVSVTREVKTGVVKFNGREILVVDQPGVGDTAHIDDTKKAAELVLNNNKDAFALNSRGYHAFLLVVRYGGRYSRDDVECVRLLNHVFGQGFLKNYGIVIVTYGDNFKSGDAENQNISFEEWCCNQEGHFKTLLDECNNRAILFDNKTKDETVRNKQVQALLDTVDQLKSDGQRYSFDKFEKYETSRQNYLIKVTEPKIRDAALNKLTLLTEEFNDLSRRKLLDDKIIAKNRTLLKKVEALRKYISDEDKESNIFADLLRIIDAFHAQIIGNVNRIQELKIEMEKIEKETKKREKEKSDFEKVMKRFAKNKQALEQKYNLSKSHLETEYRRSIESEVGESAALNKSHEIKLTDLKNRLDADLQELRIKENMATISNEKCIQFLDDLEKQKMDVSKSYNELLEKQQQEYTKTDADLKFAKEQNTKLLALIKQKEQDHTESLEARLKQLKEQIDDDPTSVDDERKIALQKELDQLYKEYTKYLKVNKCVIL